MQITEENVDRFIETFMSLIEGREVETVKSPLYPTVLVFKGDPTMYLVKESSDAVRFDYGDTTVYIEPARVVAGRYEVLLGTLLRAEGPLSNDRFDHSVKVYQDLLKQYSGDM